MDPHHNKVDRDIADNLHAHTDHEVTPQLLVFFGRMETKLDHIMAWLDKHEVEADALSNCLYFLGGWKPSWTILWHG